MPLGAAATPNDRTEGTRAHDSGFDSGECTLHRCRNLRARAELAPISSSVLALGCREPHGVQNSNDSKCDGVRPEIQCDGK